MKRYKVFSCQCGCGETDWAESTNYANEGDN